MGRVIPFPNQSGPQHGYKKARRRRRVNLEDYGQLNLFDQPREARVISLSEEENPFESALILEEEGDFENARKYYQKAIRRNMHITDAHCNLGILDSQEKRYAEAINHFTLALRHNPRHLEAHYNLGYLYSDIQNLPLARVHYELALQIDSSFPSIYYNLALVHIEQEEFELAEQRLMEYRSLTEGYDHKQAGELLDQVRQHLKRQSNE